MSASERPTAQAIATQARQVLEAVARITDEGGQPTLTAVRRSVQEFISFRLSEFVSYLDRFGLLEFRRSDGTVAVTPGGHEALKSSGEGLISTVVEHFGDRVDSPGAPVPATATDVADAPAAPDTHEEVVAATPVPDAHEEIAAAPAAAQKEPSVSYEDQYERGEALGTGGLAVVYKARQISLDRTVVVKEFRDIFQYFTQDQRALIVHRLGEVVCAQARLSHPHVVRVLDFDPHGLHPLVVVEHQVGGNLRDRMNSGDRMPVALAIQYFLQIAEALRYAHANGTVHRNLKPENVLLDSIGNAVVTDFGLTRIVEPDDDSIRQVYVGVGTVAYLAPEQYQDARNASVQGDIYSLGIMLYEMLTGKLPGRRSPMPSAYYEDVPAELDDVFDKMTMDFLDVRYDSMAAVLADVYAADDITALLERKAPVLFTGGDAATGPAKTVAEIPAAKPINGASSDAADGGAGEDVEAAADDGSGDEAGGESASADDVPAEAEAAPEEAVASDADAGADASDDDGGSVSARLDDLAGDLFGD